MTIPVDPSALSLDQLREERTQLHHEDDAVSYVRRAAQTRIDLVNAEIEQRQHPGQERPALSDSLRDVLASHLSGGGNRPPRDSGDVHNSPFAIRLEEVSTSGGFDRLRELALDELQALRQSLITFEREVSANRAERFDRLNALSSELVRRYRDGEAHVDQPTAS